MRHLHRWPSAGAVVLLLLAAAPSWAQGLDVEPNDSCPAAQGFGAVTLPFTVDGSLDSIPGLPDIDFFRVSLIPGSFVRIDHEGVGTGAGTLPDPLLGVFDASCSLIAVDDDGGGALNSRLLLEVPADGVLVLAATAWPDYAFVGGGEGSYRLTLTEQLPLGSISGRLVSARDGSPIPGDYPYWGVAELVRCETFGCWWTQAYAYADESGAFSFTTDFSGQPLLAGSYLVRAWANGFEPHQTAPFEVAAGEHLDLGDLALEPYRLIGSISGRLVDASSGNPISSSFPAWAYVILERCDEYGCYGETYTFPDNEGRFYFDGVAQFILTGNLRVIGLADQYQNATSARFDLDEGESHDVGDLALAPFPVQILGIEPCTSLPASGGTCRFGVRMRNGLAQRLQGQAWANVNAYGTGSLYNYSNFQVGKQGTVNPMPQRLNLAPRETTLVDFAFDVPAGVANGAYLCTSVLVGQNPNPLYNTVGQSYGFCIIKGDYGFRLVPDKVARRQLRELRKQERR